MTSAWPILLAFFAVVRLKKSYEGKVQKGELEHIAKAVDKIAGLLLIPVIFNAITKVDHFDWFFATFAAGFMLPVVTFAVVRLASKFTNLSVDISMQLLFSSFGGGNRGNLLLLVLFGVTTSIQSPYMTHFAILDLGNFICLLTLGFYAVKKSESNDANADFEFTNFINSIIKSYGFYALTLLVIVKNPPLKPLADLLGMLNPIFEKNQSAINALFTFLIFLAIFLRLEYVNKSDIRNMMLPFLCYRAITCIVVYLIYSLFSLPLVIYVVTLILLLMPPSSVLWSRLEIKPNNLLLAYTLPNLLYFALIFLALIITFINPDILEIFSKYLPT